MVPIRTLLSGVLGAALLIPVHPSAAEDGRTVEYRGMRLTVPEEWRVVDLERNPGACLRLDLPTLYLGHAGTQAECSGRAVRRRADTLHLEPLDGAPARADIPTLRVAGSGGIPEAAGDSHEVRYALRGSGVMATLSYGEAPDAVRELLARARTEDGAAPGAQGAPAEPASAVVGPKAVTAQAPFTGAGFDACTAPTQRAMDGWRSASPFGAIGIYIGGRARACAQPQLTAGWVRKQAEAGWHLMPLWVGPQPWHSSGTGLSTDPSEANQEGIEAAEGATQAARALGLADGTVLYNDLENYTDRTTWDPRSSPTSPPGRSGCTSSATARAPTSRRAPGARRSAPATTRPRGPCPTCCGSPPGTPGPRSPTPTWACPPVRTSGPAAAAPTSTAATTTTRTTG